MSSTYSLSLSFHARSGLTKPNGAAHESNATYDIGAVPEFLAPTTARRHLCGAVMAVPPVAHPSGIEVCPARPILNVFVRTPDGSIRHGYATELIFPPRDPGQDSCHVAAVWPMGACSISRPRARGADTHPKLSYD